MLARIWTEADLLVAECLRRRVWDGLSPAELAAGAVSPAAHAAVFAERAGEGLARRDLDGAGEPCDGHRRVPIGRRAVTEPPAAVSAPADDLAAGTQGTGVGAAFAARDRNQGAERGKADESFHRM